MSKQSIELEEKLWWAIIGVIEKESEQILRKLQNDSYSNVNDLRRKKNMEELELIGRAKYGIESRIDP